MIRDKWCTSARGTVPFQTGNYSDAHIISYGYACFLPPGRMFSLFSDHTPKFQGVELLQYKNYCKNSIDINNGPTSGCRSSAQSISHKPGNVLSDAVYTAVRRVPNRQYNQPAFTRERSPRQQKSTIIGPLDGSDTGSSAFIAAKLTATISSYHTVQHKKNPAFTAGEGSSSREIQQALLVDPEQGRQLIHSPSRTH